MEWQAMAFGNWDLYNDYPMARYFDSTLNHRRCQVFDDVNLYMPSPAAKPPHQTRRYQQARAKKSSEKLHGGWVSRELQRKQRRVCDVATENSPSPPPPRQQQKRSVGKAVDEDLYKIPPDLLYQKPSKKRPIGRILLVCLTLCLSC